MNPTWYDKMPSPYNSVYQNYGSLISKTNTELAEMWSKVNVSFPLDTDPSHWENYQPRAYHRPTPVRGWKVIPTSTFTGMLGYHEYIKTMSVDRTYIYGVCMTAAWHYASLVRFWLTNSTIFTVSATVYWYPSIPDDHAFNLILTVDDDKTTFRYWYCNYLNLVQFKDFTVDIGKRLTILTTL